MRARRENTLGDRLSISLPVYDCLVYSSSPLSLKKLRMGSRPFIRVRNFSFGNGVS